MSPVTVSLQIDVIKLFNLNISELSKNKFKQRDNLRRGSKIKVSHKNCRNKANNNLNFCFTPQFISTVRGIFV
jgi:hypothetical protein